MRKRFYLVIRADQTARVMTRVSTLRTDEIAIPMWLNFPNDWGRVSSDPIEINVPDFAPEVEVEDEDDSDVAEDTDEPR